MSDLPTIKTPRGMPKGIAFIDDLPFITTKYEDQRGQEIAGDTTSISEDRHALVVDSHPRDFKICQSPYYQECGEELDPNECVGIESNNDRRLMNWNRASVAKKIRNRKANKVARKQRRSKT